MINLDKREEFIAFCFTSCVTALVTAIVPIHLLPYLLTQVARGGGVLVAPTLRRWQPEFQPWNDGIGGFCLLPEWTSAFAAFPVPLVASGAAVQQSGRIQSKLLGQGHKPCVVLGRDRWFMCPGLGEVLGERRCGSEGEWSENGEN